MFDSDFDRSGAKGKVDRRTFLAITATAALGAAYGFLRRPNIVAAGAPTSASGDVTIVQFSDAGARLKKVHLVKVVKSEDEWRKQLSQGAFEITRHADTEVAYTGKYWDLHDKGIYRCVCCDNALFSSETKFDSGTGWPSFWAPIAKENVQATRDLTYGMVRDAVSCTLCDAHLGHVFDDGPKPTGLRYCMNSASLRFVKHS